LLLIIVLIDTKIKLGEFMKPYQRSRSVRKIFKKTPSGRTVIHTKRREKGKENKCEICGVSISRMRKNGRVFGGMICHRCISRILAYYTRILDGVLSIEDVDIKYRKYITSLLKGKR